MTGNRTRVVDLKLRGLSNYDIGKIMGVHEKTIRRWLSGEGFQPHLIPDAVVERHSEFNIEKPITLVDEDVMVTADWHFPLYNPHLANDMVSRARKLGITKLAIGGDTFNFDALSQYDPKQEDAGLEREQRTANEVFRILLETFEDIYVVWGNHDARAHKALGYKLRFNSAMRMMLGELSYEEIDRIQISNLDYMHIEFTEVDPEARRWRLCHPATYSRVPLTTPRTLAAKFNCNVICAHAHHAAIGFASDGIKTVAEIGGLFDQTKTAYLQRTTTFPTWTPGYGWFQDSRFYMTTPVWETA